MVPSLGWQLNSRNKESQAAPKHKTRWHRGHRDPFHSTPCLLLFSPPGPPSMPVFSVALFSILWVLETHLSRPYFCPTQEVENGVDHPSLPGKETDKANWGAAGGGKLELLLLLSISNASNVFTGSQPLICWDSQLHRSSLVVLSWSMTEQLPPHKVEDSCGCEQAWGPGLACVHAHTHTQTHECPQVRCGYTKPGSYPFQSQQSPQPVVSLLQSICRNGGWGRKGKDSNTKKEQQTEGPGERGAGRGCDPQGLRVPAGEVPACALQLPT